MNERRRRRVFWCFNASLYQCGCQTFVRHKCVCVCVCVCALQSGQKVPSSTSTTVTELFWGNSGLCRDTSGSDPAKVTSCTCSWFCLARGWWWFIKISRREAVFQSQVDPDPKSCRGAESLSAPLVPCKFQSVDSGKHRAVKRFPITWRFDFKVFMLRTAYTKEVQERFERCSRWCSSGWLKQSKTSSFYGGFWFHNF